VTFFVMKQELHQHKSMAQKQRRINCDETGSQLLREKGKKTKYVKVTKTNKISVKQQTVTVVVQMHVNGKICMHFKKGDTRK